MNSKTKILIVEDEAPLRNALRDKFVSEGFMVVEAKDGEEGLAVALKEQPDMILLDLIMPNMDGNAMFDKLTENKLSRDIPVIILTNESDSETILSDARKGVSDYLIKSEHTLKDIVKKVKERLGL